MKKFLLVATLFVVGTVSAQSEILSQKDEERVQSTKIELGQVSSDVVLVVDNEVSKTRCYNRDKNGTLHPVRCPDVIVIAE